jgi:hypothetical protein
MPSTQVHDFAVPWSSSDAVLLQTSVSPFSIAGGNSLRLQAMAGSSGVTATHTPGAPTDLSDRDELRFWVYADHPADGSSRHPFRLELDYQDAADPPGVTHRWVVPVNRPRVWEQRRIGLDPAPRSDITRWRFRCLTDQPLQIFVADLLAVSEEPLLDVEGALLDLLAGPIPLPGVTNVPAEPAADGADTVVVPLNPRFRSGNRITVDQTGPYAVTAATHTATTSLTVEPPLAGPIVAGAPVSVVAPVVVEEPPLAVGEVGELPDPVLLLALTDQREEPERGWNIPQRDSFRLRDGLTVCSVRPPARPVLLEYQLLVAASDREQSLTLRGGVLRRIGVDSGLRVNGTILPVQTLLPPPLDVRDRRVLSPVYLRIGTRIEQGARQELPWVQHGQVRSGPLSAPWDPADPGQRPVPRPEDQEGIVIRI